MNNWKKRIILPRAAICALLAAATGQLQAAEQNSTCELPPVQHQLEEALSAQLPQCQNNIAWLTLAEQALLRKGQHMLAANYIERALMLEPQSRELQLDYAIALAGSGQADTAALLLNALLAEPDLPSHLQKSLTLALQQLQAPEAVKKHHFMASLRVGGDSNLLGAPDLNELSLNLAGQQITLPLDTGYLSQSGSYAQTALVWSYDTHVQDTRWQTWTQLRDRHSPSVPAAELQQLSVGAEVRHSMLYANASLMGLRGKTGLNYKQSNVDIGLSRVFRQSTLQCLVNAGVQRANRDVASNPLLSGQYGGVQLQWICDPEGVNQESWPAWLLEVNTGRDQPTNATRPGGVQKETGLRLRLLTRRNKPSSTAEIALPSWASLFSDSRWLAEINLNYKKDQQLYSILLGGVPRSTSRIEGRVEWQAVLVRAPQWQVQAGVQWTRQLSNLELFRSKSHGPYVSLIRSW